MSEFDDKLSEALKSVGESFRPEDIATKQRQFMKRRKRRRLNYFGGSLALGAAVIAAVLFVTSGTTPVVNKEEDKPAPPAGRAVPVITDVIQLGDGPVGPSGIDVGPSGVWTANYDEGSVSHINPSSGDVDTISPMEISSEAGARDFALDDIAVQDEAIYVADKTSGSVLGINLGSGPPNLGPYQVGSAETHIDLTGMSGGPTWAVTEGSTRLAAFGMDAPEDQLLPEPVTDLASEEAGVWLLAGATGSLLTASSNEPFEARKVAQLPSSEAQDLAVGEGAVWAALGDAGELYKVEYLGEGKPQVVARTPFDGSFGAVSVGLDHVWIASGVGGDDPSGWLTQVDPASGLQVGESLELPGKPADVAVGAGAVWVTLPDLDSVARIELQVPEASPVPDSSPTTGDNAEEPAEYPLFVYVREGDVWAQYRDSAENLTSSPQLETEPTVSPDGSLLIYERRGSKDGSTEIVQLDLAGEGEPTVVAEGANPSIGPDGKLAWVVPADREPAQIGTMLLGSGVQKLFPVGDPNSEPIGVDDLSWSKNGDRLFFVSSYEGYALDVVDVSESFGDGAGPDLSDVRWLQPDDVEDGSTYIAPSNAYETNGIRLCCSTTVDDSYSTASFGVIHKGDGVGSFTELSNLDALDMGPYADWYTGFLGNIQMDEGGSWNEVPTPSWFFGDGRNVWSVDAKGNAERIPFDFEVTSFAAPNPLYR